ncbi:hypothetical protein BCR44DRAFT_1501396 [Catenaria anguillulae PL171]|uniref:Uncharacterized protein n=1 Tax=Catenaria anguillulae PL171 TaxID=765915 RepID=A0A1Y2HH06_9FUNG|nr:hypothetical protein BCR44DRAFT_1501396 [Catenaria anguillulae PL171]
MESPSPPHTSPTPTPTPTVGSGSGAPPSRARRATATATNASATATAERGHDSPAPASSRPSSPLPSLRTLSLSPRGRLTTRRIASLVLALSLLVALLLTPPTASAKPHNHNHNHNNHDETHDDSEPHAHTQASSSADPPPSSQDWQHPQHPAAAMAMVAAINNPIPNQLGFEVTKDTPPASAPASAPSSTPTSTLSTASASTTPATSSPAPAPVLAFAPPPRSPSAESQSQSKSKSPSPLVARAKAILADLDLRHPDWHHLGHNAVRSLLSGTALSSDTSPSSSSSSRKQAAAASGAAGDAVSVIDPQTGAGGDWLGWIHSGAASAAAAGSSDDPSNTSGEAKAAAASSPSSSKRNALKAYLDKAKEAVKLLKKVWEVDQDQEAGFMLAQIALFGNYSLPPSPQISFDLFRHLASTTGNATAHYYLGLFYSTNLGGVLTPAPSSSSSHDIPPTTTNLKAIVRQDKALVHYTLAASSGTCPGAEMALGYRYLQGIGVVQDCARAAVMYYAAAKRVIDVHLQGPPGGLRPPPHHVRLSDDVGGVYGPGSTLASKTLGASQGGGGGASATLSEEDAFDYYKMLAEKGSLKHQLDLGMALYSGTASVKPDFRRAFRYLNLAATTDYGALERAAARGAWPAGVGGGPAAGPAEDEVAAAAAAADQVPVSEALKDAKRIIGTSSGLIGQMYLRGEAVKQDNATARIWFRRGVQLDDALSLAWLGVMDIDAYELAVDVARHKHRAGVELMAGDVPPEADKRRALLALMKAAKAGQPLALAYLGHHYASLGKYAEAIQYYSLAVSHGHMLATFKLAEMHYYGLGTQANCAMAVSYLKGVVERGMEWLDPVMSVAHNLYDAGTNTELAELLYLIAAERGVEVGMANLAWMLDQSRAPTAAAATATQASLSVSSSGGGELAQAGDPMSSWVSGIQSHVAQVLSLVLDYASYATLGLIPSSSSLALSGTHLASTHTSKHPYFPSTKVNTDHLALLYWIRSANLNNDDARVKVGDYYYYGRGTPQSYSLAAASYAAATQSQQSGIAMWNLGYMYHHGLGVPRDYHMAKRYYDQSLTTDGDAWLPVSLSLLHLHVENWREVVFGSGTSGAAATADTKRADEIASAATKDSELAQKQQPDTTDPAAAPPSDAKMKDSTSPLQPPSVPNQPADNTGGAENDDDWTWHDLNKRRAKTAAHNARGMLSRMWRAAVHFVVGGDNGTATDDDIESLLLVSFCLVLAYLVYVRQNQAMARQQVMLERQEQQQQQQRAGTQQQGPAAAAPVVTDQQQRQQERQTEEAVPELVTEPAAASVATATVGLGDRADQEVRQRANAATMVPPAASSSSSSFSTSTTTTSFQSATSTSSAPLSPSSSSTSFPSYTFGRTNPFSSPSSSSSSPSSLSTQPPASSTSSVRGRSPSPVRSITVGSSSSSLSLSANGLGAPTSNAGGVTRKLSINELFALSGSSSSRPGQVAAVDPATVPLPPGGMSSGSESESEDMAHRANGGVNGVD